ncbi:glycosyltransferase family 2 protein [Clostridium bowmanii]|uniref:glycosyltransferase family 2 protein n=1 Tax=Clostridium bowmanii TaxID=132925 RepID=UPI001C0E8E9A|nr:glycosyltransferase family 2 protein [Clostridium bowmanii]MBU3191375.1 glycosyltransferase family 2 protein [Clostridium bowmanii]MCA1075780.1 glycosyltransferase family 2 protein [Clostridium bowmanii]
MERSFITVVIPVYNEEIQICENINVIRKCLAETGMEFMILLVDDGSTDDTWLKLKMLSKEASCIKALRLSRNFGKEAALCAGLEAAEGDCCIIMDADLQHPPTLIPEMIRLWRDEGYEVIEGVKALRGNESMIKKVGANSFYKILSKLSGFNMQQASDFKLLDKKVVLAWRSMHERGTFFRGMSAWVGYNRISIPFNVGIRTNGVSKWSVFNLCTLAVKAITSFSSFPLYIITFMGVFFLAGALVLGIQTLYMKLMGIALNGFTTVILLLLIIGSCLMISLGVIGTYIARIYEEVKCRPRYIVADEIKSNKDCLLSEVESIGFRPKEKASSHIE